MTRAVRALGALLSAVAIVVLGWWWLAIGRVTTGSVSVTAAAVDLALFGTFAMHHSVFARTGAKIVVARLVPDGVVRSVYVCIAGVLLMVLCTLWQPVGGLLYEAHGLVAVGLRGLQGLGVLIGLATLRRISVRELAGLTSAEVTIPLQWTGPYRIVRHPLYLSWSLIFACEPAMTGDRWLFAVASVVYIMIAIPFEEAALVRQFGEPYERYRATVRSRLVPYIH